MTYQVLARKWRPKTFADMVGQNHVLKALTNALNNNRLHHAYLFSGTRGVGKTTLARILAKCLNCEQGISAKPCGTCSACSNIDEGRFVDLVEVDAASKSKVDETRELMDNVQYVPSVGRYKVYLIDEVHMFSGHSFNALLKTLEEPPSHIKFFLATTEHKKIPVTILSRCLQFNLQPLSIQQIENQLEKILELESIPSDIKSRQLIAKSADGSLRDALSLLDQAIAYGNGHLKASQVSAMLGTIDEFDLNNLLQALALENPKDILQCIDQLSKQDPNYNLVLIELLSILQKIAVYQVLQEDTVGLDDMIKTLAQQISKENIQLYYQIGIVGRRDLPMAPDPRTGFEMILIRMLAFMTETTQHDVQTVAVQNSNSTPTSPTGQITTPATLNDWQTIIDRLAISGLTKELASHCVLKEYSDDKIHLILPPDKDSLLTATQEKQLAAALQNDKGKAITLTVSIADTTYASPHEQKSQQQKETLERTTHSLKSDPNVQTLQKEFGAEIDEKSITPI